MNRRQFTFRAVPWMVGGSLLTHNLSTFAVAEGTDYSCKAYSDIALPALNLTKIIDITVEIMWYVPYFEGEIPTPFNEYQKAKLTAISNLRAQIWSSQEFKDAVQAFKFWKCPDTSAQVYDNVTSVKQKKVKYSLSITSGESASTSNGVTRVPRLISAAKMVRLQISSTPFPMSTRIRLKRGHQDQNTPITQRLAT